MKTAVLFLFAAFTLVGCEKVVLENTTLSIDYVDAEATVEFGDDAKVLNAITEEKLFQDYIQELKDHMGRGQIDIVDGQADYTLQLTKVRFKETNKFEENKRGDEVNLSRLRIDSDFTLRDNHTESNKFFSVKGEKKEQLHVNGRFHQIIDLEDVSCENIEDARRHVKKRMLNNQ